MTAESTCANCGETAVVAIWDLTCPHCGWGYATFAGYSRENAEEGYIFNPNTWEPGLFSGDITHQLIKEKIEDHRNGEGDPVRFSSTTVSCNYPVGPGGNRRV